MKTVKYENEPGGRLIRYMTQVPAILQSVVCYNCKLIQVVIGYNIVHGEQFYSRGDVIIPGIVLEISIDSPTESVVEISLHELEI